MMTSRLAGGGLEELQAEFAALVERFAGHADGAHQTAIAPLRLFRSSMPTQPIPSIYEPALCLVAQGRKRVMLAEHTYPYDSSRYLLATMDLPIIGEVFEATPHSPYLGTRIRLDFGQMSALIAEMVLPSEPEISGAHGKANRLALSAGCLDVSLLDAVVRLLRLLGAPQHIPVLAPMILREISYLLLIGEHGDKLRELAARGGSGGDAREIAEATRWLKGHFAEPLQINELAARAHMSPSTFYRRFKAATALTPLQYQKQLRLQEARRLMLTIGADASMAGFLMGYDSATQFSREYRRLFGAPPRRDVARLRWG